MSEMSEKVLDDALEALARDVASATPRPSPDLMARVLTDAGQIAAERPAGVAKRTQVPTTQRISLSELLFGWASGAVAAMVLALALGIGVGMEIEPGSMPMTDSDDGVQIVAEALWADDEVL